MSCRSDDPAKPPGERPRLARARPARPRALRSAAWPLARVAAVQATRRRDFESQDRNKLTTCPVGNSSARIQSSL